MILKEDYTKQNGVLNRTLEAIKQFGGGRVKDVIVMIVRHELKATHKCYVCVSDSVVVAAVKCTNKLTTKCWSLNMFNLCAKLRSCQVNVPLVFLKVFVMFM